MNHLARHMDYRLSSKISLKLQVYEMSKQTSRVAPIIGLSFRMLQSPKKKHVEEFVVRNYTPPSSLTWNWKVTTFNRRYIFKWLVFHCHVMLQKSATIDPYEFFRIAGGSSVGITCGASSPQHHQEF